MGFIEDVVGVLDRIPIWKRLQGLPKEVDDLKDRIAALETQLGGKWPADLCKFCGERAVRLSSQIGPIANNKMRQSWKCEKCNKVETRIV